MHLWQVFPSTLAFSWNSHNCKFASPSPQPDIPMMVCSHHYLHKPNILWLDGHVIRIVGAKSMFYLPYISLGGERHSCSHGGLKCCQIWNAFGIRLLEKHFVQASSLVFLLVRHLVLILLSLIAISPLMLGWHVHTYHVQYYFDLLILLIHKWLHQGLATKCQILALLDFTCLSISFKFGDFLFFHFSLA